MKKITVHLGERSYPILIGRGLLTQLGAFVRPLRLGSKVLVISNREVSKHYFQTLRHSLERAHFSVALHLLKFNDERAKSVSELSRLWRRMAQIPLERTSAVVGLGGGVVGDVSAFTASTYMRGISLVHVPTTLLAQVDSAIGGKTAIDLPEAKNIVGTFYQPKMVVADIDTLKTLSFDEFRNQFAEVIKYGVIQDPILFRLLERRGPWFFSSLGRRSFGKDETAFLETVIWRSARIKAKIVEQDERETKGKRMILNYGHTFAHALEAAAGFNPKKMPHGRAVATGLILAGELACRSGVFLRQAQKRQVSLIQQIGFPAKYKFSTNRILSFMKRDKKIRYGKLRLVLPKAIGRAEVMVALSEKQVREVLDDFRRNG